MPQNIMLHVDIIPIAAAIVNTVMIVRKLTEVSASSISRSVFLYHQCGVYSTV